MSTEVYANSREISGKAADGKSICALPDTCFTPPQTPATPPGVPVPYPNSAFSSDTTDGSKSVKIGGEEIMLKDVSSFKKSSGDEAGCAPKKGVLNSKISGSVYFISWSMDVIAEGENLPRHLDKTTHNHACPTANEGAPWIHVTALHPDAKPDLVPCEAKCNTKELSKEKKSNLRKQPEYETAKDKVNKPKPLTCPVCKEGRDKLSPDHIVPVTHVTAMKFFACLPTSEQSKIVNHPNNFVGICGSCNSSKSGTLWHNWFGHKVRQKVWDEASIRQPAIKATDTLLHDLQIMISQADCPK
ncbi:DUF4150 domain-containing protein [Caballeronia concitans]|uniref:Uncharacterized protein n=1 Tax=Caballeronia concitans TaxID=1777133 RepID=A0A658QV52_9BURK|nr:DUF4150 domain-containing protein [Caballeronia concitans]KIG09605.1 protein of unknown function DUF4150 [Burkholderia sp. MR1]SAL24623.1 hypothetical protein AWB72_01901 [Caballeronia concitans]